MPSAVGRSRWRPTWARLLLALVSVAAGLEVAERAARTLDPLGISYFREVPRYFASAIQPAPPGPDGLPPADGRLFEQRPGVELTLREFDFVTNRAGLRDDDPAADVADRTGEPTPGDGAWGRERWLFLGDSVTLGWGVDDAETWVRLLERDARAVDGRPLEALNAGHLMYETVQQADLLRAWGPRLRPDVVALCFIANDFEPTYDQLLDQLEEQRRTVAERDAAGPLGRLAHALRAHFVALGGLLRYARERASDPTDPRSAAGPLRFYPENWPRNRAALDAIRAGSGLLGARFVLIDHTMPKIPELEEWAGEHDVAYVRGGFGPDDYARGIVNSVVDSHANALGNRILADRLLDGFEALGLLRRAE